VIEQLLDHEGMHTMRAILQRILAIVAMGLLAGTGFAMMAAWSPATAGLISPASAQEDDDDDDDDDDDGGQAPAGGVATGQGGTATATGDDDDDDDDDGGQAPAGGVATGQGGTAESWTGETASNERSTGTSVIGWAAPLAALAVGGATASRLAIARLGARRD
jgi:hypothetical protein